MCNDANATVKENTIDNKKMVRLVKEYRKGNEEAFEKIREELKSMTRWCLLKPKYYKLRENYEMKELYQMCDFLLIKSIKGFDASKKVKFTTYHFNMIGFKLYRYIHKYCSYKNFIFPEYLMVTHSRIKDIIHNSNKELSKEEIIKIYKDKYSDNGYRLSDAVFDYLEIKESLTYISELDDDGDGDTYTMQEVVSSPLPTPEEAFLSDNMIKDVRQAICDTLDTKEAIIIRHRFGLDCEAKSCREIGDMLGMSGQAILNAQKHALRRLRYCKSKNVLLNYIQ